MISRTILSYLLLISTVSAFGVAPQNAIKSSVSSMQGSSTTTTRATFLQSLLLGALVIPPAVAAESVTLPNGVVYTVVKQGTGPKPERGELVAIRFAAYNGETQIDNIFDTPEPYYTRLGSGALLPGVEQTLPLMQLGDRWRLTIPVSFSISLAAFRGLSCVPFYHCSTQLFLCIILHRVSWPLARRDVLLRRESLAYRRMQLLSLTWKWSDYRAKNPS